MQLSSIIGKQVLTQNGKLLGYVKDAFFQRKYAKISCLCCVDGEENPFYLPARAVRAYGDVLLATTARIPSPVGMPSPVGKCVYTHLGEFLGSVCDVLLTPDATSLFIVCNGEGQTSLAVDTLSLGENIIVRKQKEPSAPLQTADARPLPPRVGLLGKQVKRTVYDGEGNPLILANERITAETLQRARKHNRLLQLTVNTLTNLPS